VRCGARRPARFEQEWYADSDAALLDEPGDLGTARVVKQRRRELGPCGVVEQSLHSIGGVGILVEGSLTDTSGEAPACLL